MTGDQPVAVAPVGEAQSRPDLAVALAGEAALGDRLPDMLQQGGIVARSHGTGAAFRAGRRLLVAIHGCPKRSSSGRHAPGRTPNSRRGETARLIASTSRVPKGRRPPGERSSPATASVSMVISPTLPFSRTISSSRSSPVRSFSAASAANKARSRQRQPRRRDVELPCQQLQWFTPQQPAYRSQLPLRREALRRSFAGERPHNQRANP